jgi:hypothetical protein
MAQSSADFIVASRVALDGTSFATTPAAARRVTTSYISSWVFSARSSLMVRTFLAPHSESVCSGQGINNYKACKNNKDKIKLLVRGDLPLLREG